MFLFISCKIKNLQQDLNIVWIKRDIRTQDHEPLYYAEKSKLNYLIIYIFEPSILKHKDYSIRHLQFIYHSILDVNLKLKNFNKEIIIFNNEAQSVFKFLIENFTIKNIFSYQETGLIKTWNRDKNLLKLFRDNKINWKEFQKDGIIRGAKNREKWDRKWNMKINQPIIQNVFKKQQKIILQNPFILKSTLLKKIKYYPKSFQLPGETYAWKYLISFCNNRFYNYNKHISKPLESRKSCGRISPYLSWGNISVRQTSHFIKNHENYNNNKRGFNGILTRLKWRDHFIQKFEMECDYEVRCINRKYEKMTYTNDENQIKDWEKGETGFPLIDASMRCLKSTGWINFRTRAMLVSFLCHHLDCDWKKGVNHLANLFLDYEPGIHYPQFQMQAGTTGINTIRIYNPVKQSKDHDSNGVFIKKWVKELRDVPKEFIHEPWQMTEMDKIIFNVDFKYKKPIIDLKEAGKKAREKKWSFRKKSDLKLENKRILKIHVR